MSVEPGWYKDPADPSTQRYWDGEGWLGDPIPADAPPPAGPPPEKSKAAPPGGLPADGTMPGSGPYPGAPPPPGHPYPGAGPGAPPYPYGPYSAIPGHARPVAAPRPHGYALAGVGARFVARVVDTIAIFLLCVIANAWFAIQFWRDMQPFYREFWRQSYSGTVDQQQLAELIPDSAQRLLLMMIITVTAVWFAYEVPGTANTGQTLGKRVLGIKVVRLESPDRLGFGRALRRWSRLGLPTLAWPCYCVGLVLQVVDCMYLLVDRPLRQALHDKASATVVVRVPRAHTPVHAAGRGGANRRAGAASERQDTASERTASERNASERNGSVSRVGRPAGPGSGGEGGRRHAD